MRVAVKSGDKRKSGRTSASNRFNALVKGDDKRKSGRGQAKKRKNDNFGKRRTGIVGFFKSTFLYLKGKYDLLSRKKYSTIAGTFVYFFVMSVMPLAVWLTILFGRIRLPVEKVLELPVFSSVSAVAEWVREEAAYVQKSASVLLIATSLYSVTGLFFHMRRGGEIIYGYERRKSGLKVRLAALIFAFCAMIAAAVLIAAFAVGAFFAAKVFSGAALLAIDYAYLLFLSFFFVLALNAYVCPYKVRFKEVARGTLFTVAAWGIALIALAVYLKRSNTGKLYGAISALIVFLLWLYVLTCCFVAGAVINSEYVEKKEKKEKFL